MEGSVLIQYFGGKSRTYKQISNYITNNTNINNKIILSPFVGGGWVESLLPTKNMICCDKHPYLIKMYKALKNGWVPPTELSKEEYDYIKNNQDENPALTGFVGFGCSFSGKWFGGYAKNKTDRNYCLNAHNSIIKKMKTLQHAKFYCKDYREINPKNAIVYCDPPYRGTTQYSMGEFDSQEFWDVMRIWSMHNEVFVSEYNAPDDFEIIWQQEVKLDIRDKNNEKQRRIEKLFKMAK